MALPECITPATFVLIGVEETISKPLVAQVMQDIEETMFWRMEYAKRGGLDAVDLLIRTDKNIRNYYILVQGIPQKKHNELFSGKVKTRTELEKNNADYRYKNPSVKTYSYLLRLCETDEPELFNYNIETIFV